MAGMPFVGAVTLLWCFHPGNRLRAYDPSSLRECLQVSVLFSFPAAGQNTIQHSSTFFVCVLVSCGWAERHPVFICRSRVALSEHFVCFSFLRLGRTPSSIYRHSLFEYLRLGRMPSRIYSGDRAGLSHAVILVLIGRDVDY